MTNKYSSLIPPTQLVDRSNPAYTGQRAASPNPTYEVGGSFKYCLPPTLAGVPAFPQLGGVR